MFVFAVLLQLPLVSPAATTEYRLGPDDKIRLSIFEWRASLDEFFEWEAMNHDYTVGAAGELSLPLLGRVEAGGLSRDELANHIGAELAARMGLGRQPTVAIEVVEYRPFYIVGPVAEAGSYSYRPGLTVLQALSIAGGWRTDGGSLLDTERNIINTSGELDVLHMQRNDLNAQVARLEAELAQSESIEFPDELLSQRDSAEVATLLAAERLIFRARNESYETQLGALEQLKSNLGTEVPSLTAQLQTVERQVRLVEEELASVVGMVEAGLANESRQMSLERDLAQIEGERLRVETGLLRAKQEISKAEISMVELRSQRAQEIAVDLRAAQAKLDELDRRIKTKSDLITASDALSPGVIHADGSGRRAEPVYHIVRSIEGQPTELLADESTLVQPGDTVKVAIRVVGKVDAPELKSSRQSE